MKNNKLRCTAPRSEDAELRAMQAEIERTNTRLHEVATLCATVEQERDAALARLAESEAQNLMARQIILEHGEGVAGASPVQPSQALSLDLLERLNKTLTRLGYATPEGGMEHFNADLANQLYNLCRAVDSLFDREQPPAPGEAAREYMTGYGDGREWAGATNQALVGALKDATQSLETISMLAGRKTYGNPPIETFMETFSEVRGYAISRAGVGREAIAAINAKGAK